jgi:hypothetical protein
VDVESNARVEKGETVGERRNSWRVVYVLTARVGSFLSI